MDKKKATLVNTQLQKEISLKNKPTPVKQPPPKKTSSLNPNSASSFDSFLNEFDSRPKTSKQAATNHQTTSTSKPTTSSAPPPKKSITPKKPEAIDKWSFMRAIDDSDDESEADRPAVVGNKRNKVRESSSFKLSKSFPKREKRQEVKDVKEGDDGDDSDPDYKQLDGLSDESDVEYETDDEDSLDLYGQNKRKRLKNILFKISKGPKIFL